MLRRCFLAQSGRPCCTDHLDFATAALIGQTSCGCETGGWLTQDPCVGTGMHRTSGVSVSAGNDAGAMQPAVSGCSWLAASGGSATASESWQSTGWAHHGLPVAESVPPGAPVTG